MTAPPLSEMRRLSLSSRLRLDSLCVEFEERLLSGEELEPLLRSVSANCSGSSAFCRCCVREYRRIVESVLPESMRFDAIALFASLFPQDAPDLIQPTDRLSVSQARVSMPQRGSELAEGNPPLEHAGSILGSPRPAELGLSPGGSVGRYSVKECLGKGAFGCVYLATDSAGHQIALKLVHLSGPNDATGLDEIEILQTLNHSGIVSLLDFGVHEIERNVFVRFIAMPFYSRDTLSDELAMAGRCVPARCLEVGVQIADALAAAHEKGVVHGDLKPSNILLRSDGAVVLADFGLSLQSNQQATRAAEIIGSPRYMSPEQMRGETRWLDGRSDIWSLGVILYQMLAGEFPFAETEFSAMCREVQCRSPRPLRQIRPEIPESLETAVLSCLQLLPEDRFRTAADLRDQLQAIKLTIGSPRSDAENRPTTALLHTRISLLLVSAILVIALSIAFIRLGSADQKIQVRVDGRALAANETVVMTHGKVISIEICSQHSGYAYLISQNSSGECTLIRFDRDASNVPVTSDAWCSLGRIEPFYSGGKEYLLIILSSDPLKTIDPYALVSRAERTVVRGVRRASADLLMVRVPYIVQFSKEDSQPVSE